MTNADLERMLADERLLPRCTECGARSRWRLSPRGTIFAGCSRFPKCRGSISRAALAKMIEKRATGRAVLAKRRKKLAARVDAPAAEARR